MRLLGLSILLLGITLPGCMREAVHEEAYEAPGEFLLGPEDVLDITVWRNQDLSKTAVIRPDGMVSMPIVGDVRAAGLTASALAKQLNTQLAPFVPNVNVSVHVKEVNSYHIYVLGEVAKPGKYQVKSYTTLLQALSMAGGFTEYAKKGKLQVVRNSPNGDGRHHEIRITVRYTDLITGEDGSGNFVLKSGDTVVVP